MKAPHTAIRLQAAAAGAASRHWHVYMLRCADGTLYTGATNDVAARLAQHNDGRGAKYTRARLPVALVYVEGAAGRGEALRREHEIKRLARDAKRRLIEAQPSVSPIAARVTAKAAAAEG